MLSKAETYDFYVSLLVSMFHTKNTEGEKHKHCGSDSKTLRERESAPSVFWKMKHETKSETLKSYVSSSEITDIQLLYNKKWNMKDKSKVLKTYRYMWDKLQFIGLTRMNINEKINEIINVQLMIINVQNKARSA